MGFECLQDGIERINMTKMQVYAFGGTIENVECNVWADEAPNIEHLPDNGSAWS